MSSRDVVKFGDLNVIQAARLFLDWRRGIKIERWNPKHKVWLTDRFPSWNPQLKYRIKKDV